MTAVYQPTLFSIGPPVGTHPARCYPDTFYFSGCGQRRDLHVVTKAHARGMVSAHRLLDSPGLKRDLDTFALPLALDSGAFSNPKKRAPVTLDQYDALLRTFAPRFDFSINLDVLTRDDAGNITGCDVAASDRNWTELRERGHDVTYAYHPASDPRGFAEACAPALEAGDDLIAIGGLVPWLNELRTKPPGWLPAMDERWTGEAMCVNALQRIGHEALAAGERRGQPVKLHLLGVGSLPVLRCVSAEPWYQSADATTWLVASKFGRQITASPFAFGQQAPRPYLPSYMQAEQTWADRARASIGATLHACNQTTRLTGPFCVDDDDEYWTRVQLAERFGCDDETECIEYLYDVLDTPPEYAPERDGYELDEHGCPVFGDGMDAFGWPIPTGNPDGQIPADPLLQTPEQEAALAQGVLSFAA